MPVISPRRSTSSTSGSLYIPQTTSGTYSSSLANKSTTGSSALSSSSSSSTSGYSSTYRSNGYTKTPSTTYSSSSFYPGSYLSRGTYPSVSRSSYSSTPSALTGGSSALSSSYRASSYLTGGNNDTTTSSSRFGRDLDHKRGTDNTECNQNNNYSHTKSQRSSSTSRNPRASSSSYPSSSLARLVATSALEIYEKYSPANYIPKCELSRSSSLAEGAASAAATANAATTSSSSSSSSSTSLTNNDSKITSSNSISRISSNSNNNYSRRYSRHTNGTINENSEAPACSSITDTFLSVPQHSSSNGGSSRAANKLLLHVSYDLPDDSNSLRDLKISCISPTTTTTTSSTSTSSSSSQDTRDTAQLATKVRNTSSLRSTLPPISPKPTRDWDRDSSTSSILSSRNLSDDYSSSSSRKISPEQEGLCGLRNIGNTCFMNSVIQCLSHTSELTKFLKTQNGVRSSSSKDQQILSEFAKLIREMWTSNVNSVTPSELKRAFSSKHRMYSDYNQQDAQEFLRFFLDSLHSALNSGVKGDLLKIDESLSDNRKADITWEWYAKAENSVIRDLFVGQLKSTLRCTVCGNTSVTFDPVWDLSVPLPSSSRCKIEACLDLFIREEILDGDEMPTCSKCQTRRKSTKSFTIQRFPKYLVIHLKRFSETRWSKMSNIVEFPTGERELNMGPYGSNSSTNVYYSLYAISNHMGSTAGGHYVALCKHPITKKWHEFNDNVVSSELTESHLVSSSAYILFYERAN